MNAIAHHPATDGHRHWLIAGVAATAASAAVATVFVVAVAQPDAVTPRFSPTQATGGAGQGVVSACFRPSTRWPEAQAGPLPTCVRP